MPFAAKMLLDFFLPWSSPKQRATCVKLGQTLPKLAIFYPSTPTSCSATSFSPVSRDPPLFSPFSEPVFQFSRRRNEEVKRPFSRDRAFFTFYFHGTILRLSVFRTGSSLSPLGRGQNSEVEQILGSHLQHLFPLVDATFFASLPFISWQIFFHSRYFILYRIALRPRVQQSGTGFAKPLDPRVGRFRGGKFPFAVRAVFISWRFQLFENDNYFLKRSW